VTPVRFVILAAPRTGSNMMCTLLGSHPDVLCHHELFNPRGVFYALELRDGSFDLGGIDERDREPLAFLERVWSADLGHTHVGFKMTHRQNEAVLAAVLRDADVRKIVLRRENRVRTFVSKRISEELDQWEVYSEADLNGERPRVHVDVDALRESIAENEDYYSELEQVLEATGQPFLRVSYEQLVAGERARVLEFLDVPDAARAAAKLRMRSVRQNPAPLRELVTNFGELETALAGTTLAADLEDA
jgi:LPS sulfotransferase NodH